MGRCTTFLTNPAYAGAFVFGRTAPEEVARRARAGASPHGRAADRAVVCLPARAPSRLCQLGRVPGHPRAAAANVRPRGEGGGAAREGGALLQGIVRCGRCGRRMQVAYSGNDGQVPPLCVRARAPPARRRAARASRSAALRLEKAVAGAFLEAITPAGVRACAEAIGELERQHEERLPVSGSRSSAPSSRPTARNASSTRASPRTGSSPAPSKRGSEQALSRARARATQARRARDPPARAAHRTPSAKRSRGSPATSRACGRAETTTARDRKELLRTLISEVIVTVKQEPRRAEVEIVWEGGARTELHGAARSVAAPSATAPARTRSS